MSIAEILHAILSGFFIQGGLEIYVSLPFMLKNCLRLFRKYPVQYVFNINSIHAAQPAVFWRPRLRGGRGRRPSRGPKNFW